MDDTKAIWKRAFKSITRSPRSRLIGRRLSRLFDQLRLAHEESQHRYQNLRKIHQVLSATQEKYFAIFENAPHPYLLLDLSGRVLEANQSALDLLTLDRHLLLNGPLEKHLCPVDQAQFHHWLERLPGSGPCTLAAGVPGAMGHPPFTLTLSPIWDPSGSVYRLLTAIAHARGEAPSPCGKTARDGLPVNPFAPGADRLVWLDCHGVVQLSCPLDPALKGRDYLTCIPAGEQPLLRHALANAAHAKIPQSYDYPHPGEGWDATMTCWSHRVVPVLDDRQHVTGFAVFDLPIAAGVLQEHQAASARKRIFALLESLPAFVYLQTRGQTIQYANSAFRRIFGDPEGRSCFHIFRSQNHPCEACHAGEVFGNGDTRQWEVKDPQGRTYVVHDSLFRETGWEPLMLGVGMDITPRIQAEEALARSEQRFQALARMAPVGIFRADAAGEWIFVNPRWQEITGISSEMALGNHWQAAILQEDRPRVLAEWQQALLQARPFYAEFRLPKANGGVAWVVCQATPDKDETQGFVGMVGTITDMSERRSMEEALGESERRYRAIVEDQTELIGRFRPDGYLTFVNEAYCRYFNLSREEILGGHFLHHVAEEKRPRTHRLLATLTRESPVTALEHQSAATPATGNLESRWQKWTYRAIFNANGQLAEYQAVGRDITEDKKIQEAIFHLKDELELQERKRLAITLHDGVGQSMQAINLGLKLVAATFAQNPQDALKTLREMIREVLDTIAQLRDITGELRPSFLERMELVEAMRWWGGRVAERSGVEVRIHQQGELPVLGLRIKYNCFQIFQEALTNAIKHSGSKDVNITLERTDEELLRLEIADRGKGFDPQREVGLSHGLGLSIIPERVARLGGTFKVKSEPGRGATIVVLVPCRDQDCQEAVPLRAVE